MRRRGTKKLWVSVCAALMAAAVLCGCTKSGDGTKETSVKAAAETIKGPESGDKAGDKPEDKTAALSRQRPGAGQMPWQGLSVHRLKKHWERPL